MKKIYLTLSILLFTFSVNAQWSDGTNGDLTTSDHVEITSSKGNSQVKLHITNTDLTGYSVLRFGDSGSANGKAYLHRFNSNWSSSIAMWEANSVGFYESIGSMNVGGKTAFKIFTSDYNSERMRIDINGNVGIGTSNPYSILEVSATSTSWGEGIIINPAPNNYGAIFFRETSGSLTGSWSVGKLSSDNFSVLRQGLTGMIGTSRIDAPFEINYTSGKASFGGVVGIGTISTGSHKLAVEGTIGAREIKVEASGWSDFVFENDYQLRTLEEVEEHIDEKGHLPEIPSEEEVVENGINLGEMNAKLLQKIEELTLYLIEQNKENQEQQKLIEELQKEVTALKNE